jgi:hypothetical protein
MCIAMEYEYFGRIGKDPQHADTLLPWGQVAKVSRMCLMGRTAGWLKVDDVEQTPDSIVFRLSVPQIGELGWCKIEKLLNGKTRVTFSGIPYQVLVGLSDDEVNKRLARLDAVIASYFYLVEQEFQEFAEFFPEETKEEAPAEIINKNDGPGNGDDEDLRNATPKHDKRKAKEREVTRYAWMWVNKGYKKENGDNMSEFLSREEAPGYVTPSKVWALLRKLEKQGLVTKNAAGAFVPVQK